MPWHRNVAVRRLKPFSLVKRGVGVWLYLRSHARKKTFLERLAVKLTTKAYKLFRSMPLESYGLGKLNANGKEFRFNSKNTQFHSIYEYVDGYELDVMASITAFLPADGVFVDIGANWGYFALAVVTDPEFSGNVLAFEAAQNSFSDFSNVKSQLGIDERRLAAYPIAVSDTVGQAFLGGANGLHSGLVKISNIPTGVSVATKRLDDFELSRVDVIKIDVEGHELAVLYGAKQTIGRCKPVVIMENWYDPGKKKPSEEKALSTLAEMGYRLFIPALLNGEGDFLADLKGVKAEFLQLRGMEFEPWQRGFFPSRVNVLAIPGDLEVDSLIHG